MTRFPRISVHPCKYCADVTESMVMVFTTHTFGQRPSHGLQKMLSRENTVQFFPSQTEPFTSSLTRQRQTEGKFRKVPTAPQSFFKLMAGDDKDTSTLSRRRSTSVWGPFVFHPEFSRAPLLSYPLLNCRTTFSRSSKSATISASLNSHHLSLFVFWIHAIPGLAFSDLDHFPWSLQSWSSKEFLPSYAAPSLACNTPQKIC